MTEIVSKIIKCDGGEVVCVVYRFNTKLWEEVVNLELTGRLFEYEQNTHTYYELKNSKRGDKYYDNLPPKLFLDTLTNKTEIEAQIILSEKFPGFSVSINENKTAFITYPNGDFYARITNKY